MKKRPLRKKPESDVAKAASGAARESARVTFLRTMGNRALARFIGPNRQNGESASAASPRKAAKADAAGLTRRLGTGAALPEKTRRNMEHAFGADLRDLRIHTDAAAGASAEAQNANAYTLGRNIVFGPGRYAPGSAEGDHLLAHEVAHTMQQRGTGSPAPSLLESEAAEAARSVSRGQKAGPLSPSGPRIMRQDKPQKQQRIVGGGFLMLGSLGVPVPFPSPERMRHILMDTEFPLDPEVIAECTIRQTGPKQGAGTNYLFFHSDLGPIIGVEASDNEGKAWQLTFHWLPPNAPTGKAGSGAQKANPLVDDKGRPVKPPAELLGTDPKAATRDPEEAMRLYQIIREHVDVKPGEEGEEMVRFAHFLERNKGKIEGILHSDKSGARITEAEIQKIIDLYGKFIAAEPLDTPGKLETASDFDKVFKYDPNWQKMSKQDRQLLIDYSKMKPEEIESAKLDFSTLTQTMKEEMALKLVDSWAAEIAGAAADAFTDPGFIISLVLTIAIYIGLWLTPDPSFITKVAAGTLTAVMWAMFAWQDIWNTMVEYSAFEENVKKARTAAELKAAGNRMAKKIGAVGFDILMMIATWGLGKAAGPKLRAAGARRGVVRAEAAVSGAAGDPAAGVPKPAEGPAQALLSDAKASAKGTTPTAVLDALKPKLDATAQEGMQSLRNSKAGDMGTYKAIEGQAKKGLDINHFLSEKAATPEAKAQAKAKLLVSEAQLARAKLIETETIADPTLRKAARSAQMNDLVQRFKARLSDLGLMDNAKVKQAVQEQNLKALTGIMGEAIARQQLQAAIATQPNTRIVSNLGIMKEVPGYKTIAEWQRATGASSRDAAKMFQGDGKIYESMGEIDQMVVEDVPSGKPKATLIEEVKTGATDQPQKALAQVTDKVFPALQQMLAGDKSIKIFELTGKKELGGERTGAYDFSGKIQAQTRGPQGKGFQQSLGYDPEVLEETAKSLIEQGLPPAKPQTIPPITGPHKKEEKQ